MNKPKYLKMIFCLYFLTVFVLIAQAQTQSLQSDSVQSTTQDIGRENPFADIPVVKKVVPQQPRQTIDAIEELPEFSAEIVTLKNLDAKSTGAAFESMCSSFGKIVVLDRVNSLIIFEAKERLQQILDEIKKIDKPVQGLLVYAVTLQHLDAKSAKAALDKLCSENGNISIIDKSNSLIVCDTQEKVKAILDEIGKIDKPMSGLLVETVTLKFLDAKSTQDALAKMSSEFGSISVVERTNSLIICDTRKNLDMILAEIEKIDKPTSGLFIETATLRFLEAKNLKLALDKMVSQYGSIATNDKTNSLVICDTKENLAKILAEIKKADKTPQQIVIEAVIIDVKLTDDAEIGVNWDILSTNNYDIAYRQNFTNRLGSTIKDDTTIGNASAFNTTGSGGDFTLISGTIRNVVHLLQQKKDVQILASPKIMVLSGQSASIELIEEIPYRQLTQTAEAGAMSSVSFKNVGVKMSVTATLADGNDIILTVSPEQNINTAVFGIEDIPIIDTRKAQTTLLLKDGQVVVMGGLRRKEESKSRDQVPFLGDLPLIGLLFGKDKTITKNSELMLFLSPHIYKGEPLSEQELQKYNEINRYEVQKDNEEGGKKR